MNMNDFVSIFLLSWFIYNSQHTMPSHRSQSLLPTQTYKTNSKALHKQSICTYNPLLKFRFVCIQNNVKLGMCVYKITLHVPSTWHTGTYLPVYGVTSQKTLTSQLKNHQFPCLFNTKFNKGAETVQSVQWLGYSLDNPGFEFRQGHKEDTMLSLLQNVHTGSAVHPAS
jgi:hypothetical protein